MRCPVVESRRFDEPPTWQLWLEHVAWRLVHPFTDEWRITGWLKDDPTAPQAGEES